jgi:DNA repair protein RadA/Sms
LAKLKTVYICNECEYETNKWLGKCPNCNNFNTLEENVVEKIKSSVKKSTSLVTISTLNSIEDISETRVSTKIDELDRVLSGGFVEGSLTLVGGDPGIGKSTILLQICENIGNQGKKILYTSGEESRQQIKLRAERLDIKTDNLYLMAETNIGIIEQAVKQLSPDMLIIDSIQTMFREEISSAPGSVTQVRESTSAFMKIAKGLNVSVILVGHVTKEGALAGPRVLEHMVDTVLYFEGERKESYRIIRAVKNRFGSTNEIGVFEMREKGLFQITNPSEYMLSGRPMGVSGSTVTCSIEGTRPILAEVQALVSYTNFGMARRMATGVDFNRVTMLIAVLEKRLGYQMSTYDSYVNIAGGMKIVEPSVDAAAILAIASSFKDKVVDPYTLVFGEIGLTGEIRAVTMAEKRVGEAAKLGFKQCIIPQANIKGIKKSNEIRVIGVSNILELLQACLP